MNNGPEWFSAKRYGYGAGWPIAWQGWAILAGFMAAIVIAGLALDGRPALQATIVFPALIGLLTIAAKTTRGGWRWRWGDRE